jgi:hypothetical protein
MTFTKHSSIRLLINSLIETKTTMVFDFNFETVLRHYSNIKDVSGDIVECGVWRGGFSIFLAHLFKYKNVWVADSFEGFQPLDQVNYQFEGERHTPDFTMTPLGPIGISLEKVKENFYDYGLGNEDRINYLKGFVNQTLPLAPIKSISLLRIDVDSYSATLEVLDNLYNKVTSGGYIIFDDSGLPESLEAIKVFFKRYNLPLYLNHPVTDELLDMNHRYVNNDSGLPEGCYIIKK